jgi:hypothetical protein
VSLSPAGLLLVAVAGLWIAYLVPHRLRYRQQLLESRTDDRFSERLRVVRVARTDRGGFAGRQGAAPAGRVLLHPPARRGGGPVDRPHALTDRVVADAARRTAAERAHRAAHLARRAAGARRRAVLVVGLLVIATAGWAGVAFSTLVTAAGAVPTVLLAGVLVLGRRAVVVGRRADVAWAADRPARAARAAIAKAGPSAVGRAVRPSNNDTEVIARIAAQSVPPVAAPVAEATGEPTWVPVPVPRPSYALKSEVRRPEPAPLVLEDVEVEVVAEPTARPATAGFDLDSVLARRRAAGE